MLPHLRRNITSQRLCERFRYSLAGSGRGTGLAAAGVGVGLPRATTEEFLCDALKLRHAQVSPLTRAA